MNLQSGQTYAGQNFTAPLNFAGLRDVTISGGTVSGGGNFANCQRVRVLDCDVTNKALVFTGRDAIDCTFALNRFHDFTDFTGILAENQNPTGLLVYGNVFKGLREAIHLSWVLGNGTQSRGRVLYNRVSGCVRHGIECQGDANGLEVAYNWVDEWVPAAYHIGLSIATGGTGQLNDRCKGVKVHHNIVGGNNLRLPGWPDWNFNAIEAFGDDTEVFNNFMAGWGVGIYYNWNTSAFKIYDNTGVGLPHAIAGESSGSPVRPDPANVYGNRWLPAGALPTPPPYAVPPLGPDVNPTIVIDTSTPPPVKTMNVTYSTPAKGTLAFAWQPVAGATGYAYKAYASGDASKALGQGTLPAGTASVAVPNVPDSWKVTFQVTASPTGETGTAEGQYFDKDVPAATTPPPTAATMTVTTTVTTTPTMVATVTLETKDGGRTWNAKPAQ